MITRPLLAEELENLDDVKFPAMISPKFDGIRCLKVNGKILTRSFKDIPNDYVREYLRTYAADGMDGEVVTYTDGKIDDFNMIQSKVMSEDGQPDFKFLVFDFVTGGLDIPFKERYEYRESFDYNDKIEPVQHLYVHSIPEIKEAEETLVKQGYEGIMIRDPNGRYKCGRSTLKEGILLKYKRFEDSEAIILELREQEKNIGVKGVNELGKTKRSHKKADKAPADTLGEFRVKDMKTGQEFCIGTGQGLTKQLRKEIWDNKDKYLGKIIKYKYQGCGQKDLPRFPSFLGFRDERDMS